MLTLHNQKLTKNELLQQSQNAKTTDAFWHFLKSWLNNNDYIEVKTSGSTGTPKIIRLDKKRMIASAKATGKFFGLKPNDKALLCLPCDYIAGKMMVVRALVLGLDLYSVEPNSNPLEHDLIKNMDFQFAAMIPLQVLNSVANNPNEFNRIEKVIIGGGVVDNSLLEKLQNVKNQCFATYGMTETITHVAIKTLNGTQKTNFYNALENVEFSKDERDCLIINAPYLSENQLITNDIVNLQSKSNFEWLGRFDNIINTGGIKVNPENIETKIAHLLDTDFFIAAEDDAQLGSRVVLVIEKTIGKEGDFYIKNLENQLKSILSKFEMPKKIYVLPRFERTETGKIQRGKTLFKLK